MGAAVEGYSSFLKNNAVNISQEGIEKNKLSIWCKICLQWFNSPQSLTAHLESENHEYAVESVLRKNPSSSSMIMVDISSTPLEPEPKTWCTICHLAFQSPEALNIHMNLKGKKHKEWFAKVPDLMKEISNISLLPLGKIPVKKDAKLIGNHHGDAFYEDW